MSCFETGTVVELAPREVITLPRIRGATLRVTRGTLWVTQHGSPQDVVLRTGDHWTVERNGDTVIEAQRDSIFCVVARRGIAGHRLAVARPPRRDVAASLRRWFPLTQWFPPIPRFQRANANFETSTPCPSSR